MVIWVLIGYMFLFIHRPFEVWPVLGTIHLERIYAIGAILTVLFSGRTKWLPNAQHLAYFAFAVGVVVCWLCSAHMEVTQPRIEDYFKLLVVYVLIVSAVQDE